MSGRRSRHPGACRFHRIDWVVWVERTWVGFEVSGDDAARRSQIGKMVMVAAGTNLSKPLQLCV